jgi:hypothetical protein
MGGDQEIRTPSPAGSLWRRAVRTAVVVLAGPALVGAVALLVADAADRGLTSVAAYLWAAAALSAPLLIAGLTRRPPPVWRWVRVAAAVSVVADLLILAAGFLGPAAGSTGVVDRIGDRVFGATVLMLVATLGAGTAGSRSLRERLTLR